jgi:hypothetical protein
MTMMSLRPCRLWAWGLATTYCLTVTAAASGQESPDPLVVPEQLQAHVKAAIERARTSVLGGNLATGTGQGSLTAYALVKVGQSPDTPVIRDHILQIQQKVDRGGYDAGREPAFHVYEAACDAMLLADTDPQGNKERLEKLRDYLVRKQLSNGSWYYPSVPSPSAGDTSITQFAILGLWAIHRAQVEVPRDTLARAGRWLTTTQRGDGGFAYHPFDAAARSEDRLTSESMTAAGCGSLAIIKLLLYGQSAVTPSVTPTSRKKFGVLEQTTVEGEKPPERPAQRTAADTISIPRDTLDKAIASSEKTLADKFADGTRRQFPVYFLYACERTGTLLAKESFGDHRWYDAGVEFLLSKQLPSGDWDTIGGPLTGPANTAFAMLFLSRATRTLVKPVPRERLVGGGLLVGGRGLPDELDRVDVRNGTVKERLKKGPVDELLGQLEQPQEISLPTVQQAIVESVSLENPDELIGQLDRLQRLARHPENEVRQVAVWALARSGEYRMAPVLIDRLSDPDPVVAWEASLGLCVLSRMPLGIVPANSKQPLPIAPPDVSDDNPDSRVAYQRWHDQAKAAWDAWYLRVRPYDERDDRRQLPRK